MPEIDENKDVLAALDLGTGVEIGDAGQEEEGEEREAQTQDRPASTVPVGVLIEVRRQNQELKRELAAIRGDMQSFREGGGSGGQQRAQDPWADLRDMTDAELKDLADEGQDEAKRVRQFVKVREDEREARIVERTVAGLKKVTEDDDLARASVKLREFEQANPWIKDDILLASAANTAYLAERNGGKPPTEALRGMIKQMSLLVVARGHKIQGLDRIDPEFFQTLTQGRAAAPARRTPTSLDDGLGGGRGSDMRTAPPSAANAPNRVLLKAVEDMSLEEREAWGNSFD